MNGKVVRANSTRASVKVIAADSQPGRRTGDRARALPGQRLRIWELDSVFHCSVLGTCLSLGDLQRIARRTGCRLPAGATPYHVHTCFVKAMASRNELSKQVDKTLERQHQLAVRKVRRAGTLQELEALWQETLEGGNVAGAFWGAMSHVLATESLHWRLFGEVHMLSHLLGSTRRSDLCRLNRLEATSAALDSQLAQLKHEHRAVRKQKEQLAHDLMAKQRLAERLERRLVLACERIDALGMRTGVTDLEARVAELEGELAQSRAETLRSNSRDTEARVELEEARRLAAAMSNKLNQLAEEHEVLEAELRESVTVTSQLGDGLADAERPSRSLAGRRILYVGGRSHLVRYYRALAERRGADFLHHDGGVEESLDGVTRALCSVDAVVCPVDCVSHAACLKVKRACKRLAKQFIALRSSGLSSFARGLQSVV